MIEALNEQLWKTEAWRDKRWSIGIYTGNSPRTLSDHQHLSPVLTLDDVDDVPALLVADPFMTRRDGRWFMFFEVMNAGSERGEIGLASSDDGFAWQYEKIVLAEDFHLSYPHIIQHEGDVYLIPETYKADSLRLYRAVESAPPPARTNITARGNAPRLR